MGIACSDTLPVVPMVTALLLSTVPGELTELQCIRTNQKFHHKFSVFECMKIAQNYAQVSLPLSHTIQYSKMLVFVGRHFFIRKKKIKMADCKITCAFKSCEKYCFSKQNITSNVLQT